MSEFQFKSEASVVRLQREIKSTDIPNGVVLCGPTGEPMLIDYDADGKMEDFGTEVTFGEWLPSLGDTLPEDMVILVHSVKGDGQMLLKSLEVNRLLRNGRPLKVKEAAREGVLPKFIETLREKYLEELEAKSAKEKA